MITISLCMIVRNEEETIARCLASVADLVDEINIVDTGSTDRTKQIVAAFTDRIYDFEWIDDFAAARNFSFQHATQQYIMWLDADDYLQDKDRDALRELKAELTPDFDSVMMDYVLSRDLQGNTQLFTRRNRLVKRSNGFTWAHPVHEILVVSGRLLASSIEVTHAPKRELKNPKRNIAILQKRIQANGGLMTARDQFFYANELMDNGMWEEAIDNYKAFLQREVESFEQHIAACGHLSHCYRTAGDRMEELRTLFRSFEYDLPRADYCCRIGLWYEEHEQYEKAIFWYRVALQREMPPDHFGLMNKICWTWAPHVQLTLCYGKLGQLEQAYEHNEKALEYLPDEPNLLRNKEQLAAAMQQHGGTGGT